LLRAEETITFANAASAQFANLINDPFGYCDDPVPIPDGDARRVSLMTLRTRASYAMGTKPDGSVDATSGGYIQLFGFTGATDTTQASLVITYGADPDNPSVSMANYVRFNDTVNTALRAVGTGSGAFRCIAAGLRVYGTGVDTESGLLCGGSTIWPLMNSTVGFTTNSGLADADDGIIYTIKQGITVRRVTPSEGDWGGCGLGLSAWCAGPYVGSGVIPWGQMPFVKFRSLSPTTSLIIEAVHVYEVEPNLRIPTSLITPEFCADLQQIVYVANARPLTAEGHSFKGLIRWTGKAVKNVGNYLWRNVLSRPMKKLSHKSEEKLDSAIDSF